MPADLENAARSSGDGPAQGLAQKAELCQELCLNLTYDPLAHQLRAELRRCRCYLRGMGGTEHRVEVEGPVIRTPRLLLRPWSAADDEAALAVFGADEVARWLAPAMSRVPDREAMRALIGRASCRERVSCCV